MDQISRYSVFLFQGRLRWSATAIRSAFVSEDTTPRRLSRRTNIVFRDSPGRTGNQGNTVIIIDRPEMHAFTQIGRFLLQKIRPKQRYYTAGQWRFYIARRKKQNAMQFFRSTIHHSIEKRKRGETERRILPQI
jgi:hypothetical protein